MMFQILLLEQVINEIQEAHDWYEEQREGLGEELIEEVQKSYKKPSEHPQHYSFGGKQLRRLKISRFPYFLFTEL